MSVHLTANDFRLVMSSFRSCACPSIHAPRPVKNNNTVVGHARFLGRHVYFLIGAAEQRNITTAGAVQAPVRGRVARHPVRDDGRVVHGLRVYGPGQMYDVCRVVGSHSYQAAASVRVSLCKFDDREGYSWRRFCFLSSAMEHEHMGSPPV